MKSAYQDPQMAEFWDSISGEKGQTYKRYVVRPSMFRLVRTFRKKDILEVGCGNGYLGPIFIRAGANRVLMMDISKDNLKIAQNRNKSKKVKFLNHDATRKWPLRPSTFDVVYSDMMLNEVKNIKVPIEESYRCLRKGGQLVIAVTHPAWDLFEYARRTFEGSSPTIPEAGPYFERKYCEYIMSTNSLGAKYSEHYKRNFAVEHFQRPLSDYFDHLINAGFKVERLVEPELPESLLKQYPRYRKMSVHPIGLIFSARKL